MTETLTVPEVLRRAAEVIEYRGWYQGSFQDPVGDRENCAVCALGALHVAVGASPAGWIMSQEQRDLLDEAERAVKKLIPAPPTGYEAVPIWNDTVAKSASEVTAVLRQAADMAEADG